MKILCLLAVLLFSFAGISQGMNNDRLDSLLNDISKDVEREGNTWTFKYN